MESSEFEPIQGSIVEVTGDRHLGLFKVKLLKQRPDLNKVDEDDIWEAEVTQIIDPAYSYKVGSKVFITLSQGDDVIDPFIEADFTSKDCSESADSYGVAPEALEAFVRSYFNRTSSDLTSVSSNELVILLHNSLDINKFKIAFNDRFNQNIELKSEHALDDSVELIYSFIPRGFISSDMTSI